MTEPDEVSAARAIYDATAEQYATLVGTELSAAFEGPVDRAFLTAFAELVGVTAGRVADIGCGPGRVAGWLAARGLDVVGVDMSHAMLAIARDAHPHIRFEEGLLTALPFPDGSLGAAVCWYSIIHTAPDDLAEVFSELRRVLSEDGYLLMAFQAGDGERVQRDDAYGTRLSLTSFRHSLEEVARSIAASGLHVHARAVREPELEHESTPQAFVIARNVAVAPAPDASVRRHSAT